MADIAITILVKMVKYLVAPVRRQLGYVFCFNSNIESLKDDVEKLDDVKVGVQMQVDNARRNVEDIKPIVERWLVDAGTNGDEAQRIIQDKAEFPKGCFNCWCVNIKSRYSLSQSAKKKTSVIVELQKQGLGFDEVSCSAPPKPLIIATSSSTSLNSRDSMLNDIIESLKNEEISMVGICGMGGVGKTTMIGEVFKKAKEDNLFDEYAKTVVSQNLDLRKIQSDVAEMLGLKMHEQCLEVRAGRVHQRLEGKKVLIILDDVWEEFDLQLLGIDLRGGHKRCKILYTSRIKGLWMQFGSERCELELDVLPYNEAWDLFKENIGVFLCPKFEFEQIAKSIVKECGGLPLSLVILGRALRRKSRHAWNDTLLKLRTVSGVQRKVYESIKLSYDHLDDEEAKSLFLLCSLFKEDSEINIERLVDMAVGLRLFKGVRSVAEARNRVFGLVEHLHFCNLVSSIEVSNYVQKYIKIHDVVRDVSKSIALAEKGALVFEDGDKLERLQEEGVFENCMWISILSADIKELPIWLQCPKLELLICHNHQLQVPDNCFEQMVNLKVLDICCDDTQKLPSSLPCHKNLRTLCLRDCKIEDITAIGNLLSLEILRIGDETIEELPKEIGQLTNLMVLDLSLCYKLMKILRGVIPKLTNLEEFYVLIPVCWEIEGNEEGSNASLREFNALTNLQYLHILISNPRALPKIPFFKKLKKYAISTSGYFHSPISSEKMLRIRLDMDVPLDGEFKHLLYNSESVELMGAFVKDMALEFLREGSQTIIKYLKISGIGDSLDCTMASSLMCTLERFELSSMRFLRQKSCNPPVLQIHKSFAMTDCITMGADFEHPELDEIPFSCLREFYISGLQMVECLISSSDTEENSMISLFPNKVTFPSLVDLSVSCMENMKEIWGGNLRTGSFYNLGLLNLFSCDNIHYVFRPCTAKHLVHLHTLHIYGCQGLKEVVAAKKEEDGHEEGTSSIVFLPKLETIILRDLSALERFCHVAHDLEFPELKDVTIVKCPELETFAPGFVHTPKLHSVSLGLVYTGEEYYEETRMWNNDLNSTIQHLHEDASILRFK